jgi:NodT family efflux transporter outer membrane factor (OMF) lipoprotein
MYSFLRAAVLGATALSLSACTLFDMGPAAVRPQVAVPAAWAARADATTAWPDRTWWTWFRNDELNALIGEAEANSQDLVAAAARIRQAEAQVKIAGAALLPSVDAGSSTARTSSGRVSTAGGRTTTSRVITSSYRAALTAGYQLDLFGGNEAAANAAITRLASSRFDREAVALTLHGDVAATYFKILGLRDRLRLSEETLRLSEEVLRILETRREVGTVSDLEILQQRAQVASQRAQLPVLEQSERLSLDALAVLLGRLPGTLALRGQSLSDLTLPPVVAGIPSELLTRRPDLRKAEADLEAASFDTRAARAARFPSIDLTADFGYSSASLSTLFGPGGLFFGAAASLAAPIFRGGALEGREEQAVARYAELDANYRKAIFGAFADVEDALGATDTSARQYDFARGAFDQARAAFRIVDTRFRTGVADFLTVLDAQRTVFSANDALVQADLNRFNGALDLYTALGGGWAE